MKYEIIEVAENYREENHAKKIELKINEKINVSLWWSRNSGRFA